MAKKWEKGMQSPNPTGRPKSSGVSLSKELCKQLAETDPSTGRQNVELVAQALVRRMKRGEPNALKIGFERVDGAVAQKLSLEANVNVSREQRLAKVEELLATLPDDGTTDQRVN